MSDSRIRIPGCKKAQKIGSKGDEPKSVINQECVPNQQPLRDIKEQQIRPQQACAPEIATEDVIQQSELAIQSLVDIVVDFIFKEDVL